MEAARPCFRPIQTLVRLATLESYIASLITSVVPGLFLYLRPSLSVCIYPFFATGEADSTGYGITQYGTMRTDSHIHIAEEERIRKNQQLMDAYGYKDNIDDLQKALEAYEIR